MKAHKHQFHCEKCGTACVIYKKGKAHRVLICPHCGILATNPFSLRKSLFGAVKGGVGSIPVVGGAIMGATEGFEAKSGVSRPEGVRQGITRFDNLDKPNKGERYVHEALHGGR